MQVNIDKFELLSLMKGCAMGSHLTQGIWQREVDEFYPLLTSEEREWVYTYAKRNVTPFFCNCNDKFNIKHPGAEDFLKFLACYNPLNRFTVKLDGKVDGKHKRQTVNAFKWFVTTFDDEGNFKNVPRYFVGMTRYCDPRLASIKDVACNTDYDCCGNGKCELCKYCARFAPDWPEWCITSYTCSMFIDKRNWTGLDNGILDKCLRNERY